MIQSSNISKLRSGEAISFFDNLKSILSTFNLDQLQLSSASEELLSSINALTELYKNERGSKITRTLVLLDQKRDNLFMAIRLILEQHIKAHPQESLRPKAEDILNTFNKFGADLYRKNYQEETAGLKGIIKTMEANFELLENIRLLNLTGYYEALRLANQEFDQAYLERNSAYANLPKEKMQEERNKAEKTFDALVLKINAHLVLSKDPSAYEPLADQINSLVNTYQDVVNRRGSSNGMIEELDADFSEVES